MIRHLFVGALATTALVATVVGTAAAWQSGGSSSASATAGANSAVVYITNIPGARIGPDGGPAVHVANVRVENTGSFALVIDSATVDVFDVDPLAPGGATCSPGHFIGTATDLPAAAFGPPPPVPSFSNPPFKVKVAANPGAPADCMGDRVHYDVTVNVSNP